jgi:mannose-6-phosphate isomerase-like protein (cupin superfamily)
MAAYRVSNLRTEIDDQAPNFGFHDGQVEVRMARVPLDCSDCGVSYARLGPGFRLPYGHSHKRQEEIYVLITGGARLKVGDDVLEMEPWTAVRIPPETVRSIEGGPDGAELLFIGAPNTGPGDGVSFPDWWSD